MSRRVVFYFLLILILLFSLFSLYYLKATKNKLQVNFFDVGQGDSILIEAPAGQNILIDGGPDDKVLFQLGRSLPFWDRTIDLMILTHPHSDHISGLIEVLDRYNVKKVLYTDVGCHSTLYHKWERAIAGKNIKVMTTKSQQKIKLSQNCYLKILSPLTFLPNKDIDNLNNSSIVSKLDCQNTSFLFTGDIERRAKEELVASEFDLQAEILKAAHHGDREEGSGFLKEVSPEMVVVSVGDNDYGLPDMLYLRKLKDKGIQVFRTDNQGTVIFEKDNSQANVEFGSLGIEDIFY